MLLGIRRFFTSAKDPSTSHGDSSQKKAPAAWPGFFIRQI